MMLDLTVEQHSTWNGLVVNHPMWRLHMNFQAISQTVSRMTTQHASHHVCLVSETTIFCFTAHVSLLQPLITFPTVLGRIGDTYQTYCNIYKTHAMATHSGGSGQPLDRDTNMTREEQAVVDTSVEVQQGFHPEDTAEFEVLEHNNPTRLTGNTSELDDLSQRIQADEGRPTESLHCIEQELQ